MHWSHEYIGPAEHMVESVCAGAASGLGSVPEETTGPTM